MDQVIKSLHDFIRLRRIYTKSRKRDLKKEIPIQYAYLFYAWGEAIVKVVDDRTLYVYDLESPNYINDPSDEWREMAGQNQ